MDMLELSFHFFFNYIHFRVRARRRFITSDTDQSSGVSASFRISSRLIGLHPTTSKLVEKVILNACYCFPKDIIPTDCFFKRLNRFSSIILYWIVVRDAINILSDGNFKFCFCLPKPNCAFLFFYKISFLVCTTVQRTL